MPRERRNFTGTQKLAILREHLIEQVPVSEVCEKHGIQPTVFYQWQKKLFEEGGAVFEQPRAKSSRQQSAEARRITDAPTSQLDQFLPDRWLATRNAASVK